MARERVLSLQSLDKARLEQASRFLDEELKPAIISGEDLDKESVDQLLAQFRMKNRVEDKMQGADFTIEHVWITALYELSECVVSSQENCDVPDDIPLDLEVFNVVNQLDVDRSAFKFLKDI